MNDTRHKHQARRKLIKSVVAGGSILTTGKILPDAWHAPLVESVQLPAHAAGSPGPLDGLYVFSQLSSQREGGQLLAQASERVVDMLLPSAHASHCDGSVGSVVIEINGNLAKVCLYFKESVFERQTSVNQQSGELADILNISCVIDLKDMRVRADGSAVDGSAFPVDKPDHLCVFKAPRSIGSFFCNVNVTSTGAMSSPYPIENTA